MFICGCTCIWLGASFYQVDFLLLFAKYKNLLKCSQNTRATQDRGLLNEIVMRVYREEAKSVYYEDM